MDDRAAFTPVGLINRRNERFRADPVSLVEDLDYYTRRNSPSLTCGIS